MQQSVKLCKSEITSRTMTVMEWFILQVEAISELLEVCLQTTYFQVGIRFFKQKDGMARSFLSLIISNTYRQLWLLTHYITNHFSSMVIHLWSGLMAQSGSRISSATSIV
jgi:hypothetical protein